MGLPVSRSNVPNYLDVRLARTEKEDMIRGELDKSLGLCPAKTPFRARSEVPILVTWEEEFLCSIQILLRSYGGRERGYPTTSHRLSEVMLQLLLLRISYAFRRVLLSEASVGAKTTAAEAWLLHGRVAWDESSHLRHCGLLWMTWRVKQNLLWGSFLSLSL